MSGPSFTADEQQFLVWLSYQKPNLESVTGKASLDSVLQSIKTNVAVDRDSGQAARYQELLANGAYPNLEKFTVKAVSGGHWNGYEGVALTDGTNRILLNGGSNSGDAGDWLGNFWGGVVSGRHPQQGTADDFYKRNKAGKGGWNYMVGHSLGGGLTIGVLLGVGRNDNTFAYVENSADFMKSALLSPQWLLNFGLTTAAEVEAILQGRLQMGASGGDVLSWISGTKGTKLRGRFKDAGGHNRDYGYALMLLEVDTDVALRLRDSVLRALSTAEQVHAEIDTIGPSIVRDVWDALGAAVKPVDASANPVTTALTLIQAFPGRVAAIVRPIIPSILAGGGVIRMQAHLHHDPHLSRNDLRTIADYLGYVATEIGDCENKRRSAAAQRLSS